MFSHPRRKSSGMFTFNMDLLTHAFASRQEKTPMPRRCRRERLPCSTLQAAICGCLTARMRCASLGTYLRTLAARCARVLIGFTLENRRVQGMPGARCTRGPVRNEVGSGAHEHTGEAEASGIPCVMALRLMPCSPRRRIRLVTVAAGLMADRLRSETILPPTA
jgi:hypothetical protein